MGGSCWELLELCLVTEQGWDVVLRGEGLEIGGGCVRLYFGEATAVAHGHAEFHSFIKFQA